LDVVALQTPTVETGNVSVTETARSISSPAQPVFDPKETAFELGLWLSGLESFLSFRNYLFAEESRAKAGARDWTKEFRLAHSTLLLCAKLNFRYGNAGSLPGAKPEKNGSNKPGDSFPEISAEETIEFSLVLKEVILLNEGMLRAIPLRYGEWTSWCALLSEKLKAAPAFDKLVRCADKAGDDFVPEGLSKLLESKTLPPAEQTDLNTILRRFSRILKSLSVVGRMLKNDEPLKPTLLIFSRIYEQTQEMIAYINNRLLRFPDEEAPLFGSLDGAAYTASIEMKKVYNQELTGLIGIRPSPTVYARIETAYSLLNDSFQQILAGFASLIDPATRPSSIFPNFDVKYEQSLALRADLWKILQSVQAAEHEPDKARIERVKKDLTAFLKETVHFMFYKDKETVERFVEEILIARDKKDLVPILHRFGAYLETLFGQVNMRSVLLDSPFDQSRGS
jgi:hypothetical protein